MFYLTALFMVSIDLTIVDCSASNSIDAIFKRIPLFSSSYDTSEAFGADNPSDERSAYWKEAEGQFTNKLPSKNFDILKPILKCVEQKGFSCSSGRSYRSIDGSCNNLRQPSAGTVGDTLERIAKPAYDKGIFRMIAQNGDFLSNPRLISRELQKMKRKIPVKPNNLFWIFFGQFVDHDLTSVPVATDETTGKPYDCKPCNSWTTFACAPILISKEDTFIPSSGSKGKSNCIPFTRSAAKRNNYGSDTILDQVNEVTSYLDLSTVYGSDRCTEEQIRLFHHGALVETKDPVSNYGMVPLIINGDLGDCRSLHGKCGIAGDRRSNENLGLLMIHILFLREHNRLAKQLKLLNPHWEDERLFQEARKINIAQYQIIIYENFLPGLIGNQHMERYDLNIMQGVRQGTYYERYSEAISPQTINEFAAAAFRVGHTLLQNDIITRNDHYLPTGSLPLTELFKNSTILFEENIMEEMVRGMIGTRVEAFDPVIEDSLTNKLFIEDSPESAQDLISINIARARDHGIPGYTVYRKVCGLPEVKTWMDLEVGSGDLRSLQKVYKDVSDIDLFVGGLCERALPDAIVGPTFACIISLQFHNSKRGDRFWFENRDSTFTPNQLIALKTSSPLQRIVAFNLERPMYLPEFPFMLPDSKRNPLLSSTTVEDLKIEFWNDTQNFKHLRKNCRYKNSIISDSHIINVSPCLKCTCLEGKVKCDIFLAGCTSSYEPADESCRLLCGS